MYQSMEDSTLKLDGARWHIFVCASTYFLTEPACMSESSSHTMVPSANLEGYWLEYALRIFPFLAENLGRNFGTTPLQDQWALQ